MQQKYLFGGFVPNKAELNFAKRRRWFFYRKLIAVMVFGVGGL